MHFKNRLRRRSRLQLRRLLERRSSKGNGVPLQQSSLSLRWLTGLKVLLYHLCPSSSSLQVCYIMVRQKFIYSLSKTRWSVIT